MTTPLPDPRAFATTHWTMVIAAGGQSSQAAEALAELCQIYWFPLYAYVRRRGHDPDESKDLTQAFFAKLLEKNYLEVAQPERGRFRAFLITAFKHFLLNEWQREQAQKRGGGQRPLSLDYEHGESRYRLEPADTQTPETLYERQWVLTLLDQVLSGLRAEFERSGKLREFECLKPLITARSDQLTSTDAAAELGISPGAVKSASHRLRLRYRELLRTHIARTVDGPDEVEAELQQLFVALGK